MIKTFKHKGLKQLFETGKTGKIDAKLQRGCLRRLDALEQAFSPENMLVPGFDFHPLQGKPQCYSVHVNGPFCIIFEWVDGHAVRVDFVNYH